MGCILATRHIRSLYFDTCFTSVLAVIANNREDEPFNYVTESARWFYKTLRGDVLPEKQLLDCSSFAYWFLRTAFENSPPQQHIAPCLLVSDINTKSIASSETFLEDATLWYSYLHKKVAVGSTWHKARKLSLEQFLDMDEIEAIIWANRRCTRTLGAVEEPQEYLQERIL